MGISVCIATYNGEKYIIEQLRSIIPQLDKDDEIVISDDSSTDRTVELIRSLNDSRIVVYPNQTFKNPIFNFENAIKCAKGDIILLSDQDDIWLEGKVAYYKQHLKESVLLMTDAIVVDDKDKVLIHSFFEYKNSGSGILKNLTKNTYMGACMGFNKRLKKFIIPFPASVTAHDFWIGITAELVGKVSFNKVTFLKYRRHANNSSSTAEKSKSGILKLIKYRWNIIRYIPLIYARKFQSG